MNKAIFVFANYGLIDHKHDAGEGYDAFRVLLSNQEKDAADEESSLPTLRRGRRIMDDAPSRLRVRANLTMPLPSRGPRKWADGLCPRQGASETGRLARRQVDLPPVNLRSQVEGLRLAAWQDLHETVTRVTPRLFKKINYRIKWADNSKGAASLKVDNYAHGEDVLPLTRGCCLCPRKTWPRPRTHADDTAMTHSGDPRPGRVAELAVITA